MTSLDATAGKKKWPEKADVRIDIEPKSPDVIKMDATDLKFPEGHFDAIYFHPPYVVDGGKLQKLIGRWAVFWKWTEWLNFLAASEKEFYRCLKADGRLIVNVDEGEFYGMAHFDDLTWYYRTRWVVEKDERTRYTPTDKKPFGNIARHIITFRKA